MKNNESLRNEYFKTPVSSYTQTRILLSKNILVLFKKSNFGFIQILTIVLINIAILLFNFMIKYSYQNEPSLIYKIENVTNIQKCNFEPNCKSLGYAIIGKKEEWIDYSLEQISNKSKLALNTDIYKIYEGEDITELFDSIKQNSTSSSFPTIVIYCSSQLKIGNLTLDCKTIEHTYVYWLLYNQSLTSQNFLDNLNSPRKASLEALKTARMVENSLSNWVMKSLSKDWKTEIEHNFTFQNYPRVQSHVFTLYDTSSEQFSFWYYIPIMISFLAFNSEILKEKENFLRIGLMYFGVNSLPYWTSWIITILIFDIIASGVIVLLGDICRFSVFVNTSFWIMWLTLLTLMFGTHSVGVFISCLASGRKSGSKFSYGFALISLFIHLLFGEGTFIKFFYLEKMSFLFSFVKFFLSFFPSFLVMSVLVNIIGTTGNNYNGHTGAFTKGVEYPRRAFFHELKGEIFGKTFIRPAPIFSLAQIWILSIFYFFLVFVFDSLVSSNKGYSENPFSIFNRKKKFKDNHEIEEEENIPYVIETRNISKIYNQFCTKKNLKEFSLKNLSLKVRKGEILGLLGPNGAGKTTLIKILSGILNLTEGEYFCLGINSQYNSNQIRSHCNVCPQFDILWPELSIFDHISMICKLKGINESKIKIRDFSLSLMKKVALEDSLLEKISNLSGGMRRRVSIALSTIGSPKIIVFDEPTTGLDPENRHLIWDFITDLKKSQEITLILSSHILEEVDALSDRVAVLDRGILRALGTSSELKKLHGQGLKLNINLKKNSEIEVKKVEKFIRKNGPGCELIDSSGGSLLFVMPISRMEEMKKLLKEMENKDPIMDNIEYYSVSNSTLEEVFIEITKDEQEEEVLITEDS